MSRVCIGIPCYRDVSAETLEDYMRFAYYCGRRIPEHDFMLAIKSKSEQFRARNAITEAAIQTACDYLFFLDDDHVIDWEGERGPTQKYAMLQTLIGHLEADPKRGIVGALYYHRGADCRPVVMKTGTDGGTYWMRDDQIIGELQEVAVTGGGCMLLRLSMFDKIKSPWFSPEFDLGTDLQICKKAVEAGYTVWCDTSIKIGHVMTNREVITPNNRHRIATESASRIAQTGDGMQTEWATNSALQLYRMDAEEYLGVPFTEMGKIAEKYNVEDIVASGNLESYYASRGKEQLARQVMFHHQPQMIQQTELFLGAINKNAPGYAVDFGCGSAPVGMELVMRGHRMDFIDVDGAVAYEFTKWRAKKRGVADRCGWTWGGPYDYALLLDALEHIPDWEKPLGEICDRLKEKGVIITNYFLNMDYNNPEHISMDKSAVVKFLHTKGIFSLNQCLWVKADLGFMDKKPAADSAA